jgi:shikimate kinase
MQIFLIGFMGSGKTTLGKQIAKKLNCEFIDQDEYIEEKTGLTIAGYFSRFGEESFRKLENEVLKTLVSYDNVVVSTGGGTPCFYNNMEIMNNEGIAIYLRHKPEILFSRLKHAQNERPLIKDKSEIELMDFIKQKLKEREPFYLKAKYVIEAKDLKADDLVHLIQYHNPT